MAPSLTPEPLSDLLLRLGQLLEAGGEPRWSQSMQRLAARTLDSADTPAHQEAVRELLTLFGGMGSFNDLVLQDQRGVLPEQAELDELRSRLFVAAQAHLR